MRSRGAPLRNEEMHSRYHWDKNHLPTTESPRLVRDSLTKDIFSLISPQKTSLNAYRAKENSSQRRRFFESTDPFTSKKYSLPDSDIFLKSMYKDDDIAEDIRTKDALFDTIAASVNKASPQRKPAFFHHKVRENNEKRVFEVPKHIRVPSVSSKHQHKRAKLNFSIDYQRRPFTNEFRLATLNQTLSPAAPKAELARVSLRLSSLQTANRQFRREKSPKSPQSPLIKRVTVEKPDDDLSPKVCKLETPGLKKSHVAKDFRIGERKILNASVITKIEVNPETKTLQSSIYCLGLSKRTNLKNFLSLEK